MASTVYETDNCLGASHKLVFGDNERRTPCLQISDQLRVREIMLENLSIAFELHS